MSIDVDITVTLDTDDLVEAAKFATDAEKYLRLDVDGSPQPSIRSVDTRISRNL